MPAPQGVLECQGLPKIIGGELTWSRGVAPSVFRVRMVPAANLPPFVGTMTLRFGAESIDFPDCATAPHVTRIWKGRIPVAWSVLVYDRRWKWRYPRIHGEYNTTLCDGSMKSKTSLHDLLAKCLEALGEGSVTYRNVPTVYPRVSWNNAYAARELEYLLDLAGLVVWLDLNNTVVIDRIGSGDELPTNFRKVVPNGQYQNSIKPSHVAVTTGPTILQTKLDIGEAVAPDIDGSIKPIDELSYKPATGWESQWYTCFSDVAQSHRHLAFRYVWRWYRLRGQDSGELSIPGDPTPIASIDQYKLFDRLAEEAADSLGIKRCLDPVVRGIYWPNSDHPKNTAEDSHYPGDFRIRPDLHVVEFEHPVIRWGSSGNVLPADLHLAVAYTVARDSGGIAYDAFVKDVPNALAPTFPRVEKRPYLKRVRNEWPVYGPALDNTSDIEAEANVYLDSVIATYGDDREQDYLYGGICPVNLSGKVAQVRIRWGNDRVATTRASMNHEFDCTVPSHQERRRRERLGQLVDRVLDS